MEMKAVIQAKVANLVRDIAIADAVVVAGDETASKIKMDQLAHLVKIILMRAPAEMKRAVQRIAGDDVG